MDAKTLLVVVDMQNDFISGALGSPEAQAIVPRVREKIKGAARVIFTRDSHDEDYLSTQEGRLLPVVHCVSGTRGHEIAEGLTDLAPKASPLINKGGFGSPVLGEKVCQMYREGQIERVELVGLCTDICVITNALVIKAFCPEIPIAVDAACCAGVTKDSHQTALQAMRSCQIEVLNPD